MANSCWQSQQAWIDRHGELRSAVTASSGQQSSGASVAVTATLALFWPVLNHNAHMDLNRSLADSGRTDLFEVPYFKPIVLGTAKAIEDSNEAMCRYCRANLVLLYHKVVGMIEPAKPEIRHTSPCKDHRSPRKCDGYSGCHRQSQQVDSVFSAPWSMVPYCLQTI